LAVRRFNKLKTTQIAIAIPVPKNQTLPLGVNERVNVVAIKKRPKTNVTVAGSV
jgi:hypothetical protein